MIDVGIGIERIGKKNEKVLEKESEDEIIKKEEIIIEEESIFRMESIKDSRIEREGIGEKRGGIREGKLKKINVGNVEEERMVESMKMLINKKKRIGDWNVKEGKEEEERERILMKIMKRKGIKMWGIENKK